MLCVAYVAVDTAVERVHRHADELWCRLTDLQQQVCPYVCLHVRLSLVDFLCVCLLFDCLSICVFACCYAIACMFDCTSVYSCLTICMLARSPCMVAMMSISF